MANQETLRVLSYNIHKGFSFGNIVFLLEEIRRAIRLVDSDLVFLQEVCGFREVETSSRTEAADQGSGRAKSKLFSLRHNLMTEFSQKIASHPLANRFGRYRAEHKDRKAPDSETGIDLADPTDLSQMEQNGAASLAYQFEYLADTIWDHHAYGRNALYAKGHHGNAVLSKAPFLEWENIDISVHGFSQRGMLHGVIDANAFSSTPDDHQSKNPRQLHVLCVHLGLMEPERRKQVDMLCQRVEEAIPENDPLIIAGDFNDWRGAADRRITKRLGLVEAYRELRGSLPKTFPVWLPIMPLDRVYFRGIEAISAEALTGSPWNRLSDHAPLCVEYALKWD